MKTLLFDADGVLTLPEDFFMSVYAKSRGLDMQPFEDFFKNNWGAIVTGKKDLKESILAGVGGALGANVGSRLALKKGNEFVFVMNVLIVAMLFSGAALLFSLKK